MNFILVLMMSFYGFSAPEVKEEKKAATTEATTNTAVKKSTDMSFDELLVQGKYHFTDEAVTTVEQDKVLDGLLEVRKDFKDRIQQSAARY
jgi:hypothetical protein